MAEFVIQDQLVAQLRVDTSMVKKDVEKGLPEAQEGLKKVEQATDSVESATVRWTKSQDSLFIKAKKVASSLVDNYNKVQAAVITVTAAVGGAFLAVKALGDAANTRDGLLGLGVDEARVNRISQLLNGTVDKLSLSRKLLDASNSGIMASQFEDMAKSAAFIAKQLGVSKEQALELVSQGSLTDGQLQKIGTSALAIQNKISAIELKRSGTLDDMTRKQERIKAILDAARKSSRNFTTSTQQAGDASARLYAEFKNTSEELGRAALPALNKIAKSATSFLQAMQKVPGIFEEIGRNPVIKETVETYKSFVRLVKYTKDQVKDFVGDSSGWAKILKSAMYEALPGQLKLALRIIPKASTAIKSLAKDVKQLEVGGKKAATAYVPDPKVLAKAEADSKAYFDRIKRQIEEEKREATRRAKARRDEQKRQRIEEARARQEAAKDLVRNSSEKLIQTIADQGGAFGTIASAMTDVFEKTRMFSATGWGLDGIRAFTKIAQENRNNANADLVKQIELNKERLKIDGKALEAAKLLAGWAQGGADDTKEFVANEKAANAQLRTGLSLLQSRAKVGQLVLERANLQKDVTQFQEKTEKSINILMARRDTLAIIGTKEAKAQAAQHVIAIQRLERTNKTFQKIAAERKQILAIAERHAQIELSIEKQQKRNANRRAVEDMQAQVAAARRQLASLRGGGDGAGFLADQKAKAQETKRAIEDLSLRAGQLQQQMLAGFANAGDKQVAQDELAAIKERIRLHKELLDANKQVTDEKLRGLTVTGAFIDQMRTQAKDFTKQVGVQLAGTFQGFMGSVGNGVAGMFQTIASGGELTAQEMGKNFLNILGDIAMQMGGFFVAAGTAQMFVPPYTGAGAIAGGLALMGLGGALKGGAAAISTPQTAAPSAPTFALGNNQPNLLPADTSRGDRRPVELHYHVGRTPWSRTTPTPEQDYADMMAWSGQMSRRTGLADPFAPAAAMGGLRG